jgi:hypothetical protein
MIPDYQLAASKWGAYEEPASAPWARTEETSEDEDIWYELFGWLRDGLS